MVVGNICSGAHWRPLLSSKLVIKFGLIYLFMSMFIVCDGSMDSSPVNGICVKFSFRIMFVYELSCRLCQGGLNKLLVK